MRLSAPPKSFRTQPAAEGGAGETMRDTRRRRTRAHIRCTLQSTDLWEYFVTYSTPNHPRLATAGPSGRASACARGYGGTGRRRGDCNPDKRHRDLADSTAKPNGTRPFAEPDS